jgi:hypothetical protein
MKLQIVCKKKLLGRRLEKLIPELMPIYYHPLAKGGYMHKKEMLKFLTE